MSKCTKYPCPPSIIIDGMVLHPDQVVSLVSAQQATIERLEAELDEIKSEEEIHNTILQAENTKLSEKEIAQWQRCQLLERENTKLQAVVDAAKVVVEADLLPPEGDYYHSELDQEIMDALAKAIKALENEK